MPNFSAHLVNDTWNVPTTLGFVGNAVQNPADPDVTYDGHKVAGSQIPLSETYSDANEVQLIVGAIPKMAVAHDAHAVAPMLENLQEQDLCPRRCRRTRPTAATRTCNWQKPWESS